MVEFIFGDCGGVDGFVAKGTTFLRTALTPYQSYNGGLSPQHG
jgi:hypothetical protein